MSRKTDAHQHALQQTREKTIAPKRIRDTIGKTPLDWAKYLASKKAEHVEEETEKKNRPPAALIKR